MFDFVKLTSYDGGELFVNLATSCVSARRTIPILCAGKLALPSAPADFIRYASTVVGLSNGDQIGVMEDTDDILALAEIAVVELVDDDESDESEA